MNRKQLLLCLSASLVAGFLLSSWFSSSSSLPEKTMSVEFVNTSEQMIDSLQLDFGHAQGQTSLLSLRLAPGERRILLLNHQPGAGFNVVARYADGVEQDFCANRGEQGQRQEVILQR